MPTFKTKYKIKSISTHTKQIQSAFCRNKSITLWIPWHERMH